ncbi:MAG: BamA/TamA family outer membrane protein [Chitinispirillaceae bacterium]|nr:BamA/TamA family outer membrane protein [Chitinispirillaceae bacterium]
MVKQRKMYPDKTVRFYVLATLLSAASCTATRFVQKGDKLYTGADITVTTSDAAVDKRNVKKTAKQSLRPRPNHAFLWMRPRLWLYYRAGDSTGTRFGAWIRNTLGEPPVVMSSVKPDKTAAQIDTDLFNIGYFRSATSYSLTEQEKTARVSYECEVHSPYTISKITHSLSDSLLQQIIDSSKTHSLLKVGDVYTLEAAKKERERIDALLKDRGYFYFNPDYLLFKAYVGEDTPTVNLDLSMKDATPARAFIPCRIGTVYVDPGYSLRRDTSRATNDTSIVDGVVFLRASKIHRKVILGSIFIRTNDLYSRTRHSVSLNRLMTMGSYNYAEIKYFPSDTSHPGVLNAHVLLTPMARRLFGSELVLVHKSNDFAGPELTVGYQERNIFGGAELFKIDLNGSLETQFSGIYKNRYSFKVNPTTKLEMPRLIIPFIRQPSGYFIPKTAISLGYSFIKRIDFFDLQSLQAAFGYTWKEDIRKEHTLNPLNVNFSSISNASVRFNGLLDSIPFLKRSYEEQFIAGTKYSFTYNERMIPERKNRLYVNITTESSGNALWLTDKIVTKINDSPENQHGIAGFDYSQFVRATVDARYYFTFPDNNKLVFRLYCGIGKAYGNSSTLPYTRQFFSGGTSGVRAFPVTTLGPGTYVHDGSSYIELGGDVKVEANVEYRWNVISIVKGAIFVDAGNNWLLQPVSSIDSRPFALNRFYRELGVGAGIGLRLDASFFVVRCDLAMPLRKPWLNENERWVLTAIDFGRYGWRRDNLIVNIAIGYPF